MMIILGRHILAEIYGCSCKKLNDNEFIEKIMVQSALKSGAVVKNSMFHKFYPHGISGVVIISESHLTIHTWPEYMYAAVDVFTCGDSVNPWVACNYITEYLEAKNMTATEVNRGIIEKDVSIKKFIY